MRTVTRIMTPQEELDAIDAELEGLRKELEVTEAMVDRDLAEVERQMADPFRMSAPSYGNLLKAQKASLLRMKQDFVRSRLPAPTTQPVSAGVGNFPACYQNNEPDYGPCVDCPYETACQYQQREKGKRPDRPSPREVYPVLPVQD